MSELARGFILRTRPLTETSMIVHWLTEEQGRIATVAKGARRPKSAFRGKLDLFHEAEFSFVRSKRSDLHNLREVKVANTFPALREDYGKLNQAAYAGILIEQTTETETPIPEIYEIYAPFIGAIARREITPASVLQYEVVMLDRLGFRPDLTKLRLSAESKDVLENWLSDEGFQTEFNSNPKLLAELARFLQNYMLHHLGKVPRNREQALALSSSEREETV